MLRAIYASALLIIASACAPSPAPPAQPTPDVQGTVSAAVAATVITLAAPVSATATVLASVPAAPTPTVSEARWRIDAEKWLGSYPAGVDPLAQSEAMSAILARNQAQLNQLRVAGRVFDVYTGDEAVIVQSDLPSFRRVRLLTGNAAGKTVWVPTEMLQPITR